MNSEIIIINKKNGMKYSVRKDRHRYFFPAEWNVFYKTINNPKHKLLFLTLLNSGARIMEALHLKASDFDFNRNTITFNVIKHRTAKKTFYATGTSRTFNVSEKYLKEVSKFIKLKKINPEDFLFMEKNKLPKDYEKLSNIKKKKYYSGYATAYAALFKRKLKKANIPDWKNFSLHNIRKTYGNWMRVFEIKMEELCYRLGHDIETFMSNYGSSLIFTPEERREILNIIGEIK